tara:strand:- start:315 stop:551 length:237 start_codon:yes stop_codon:yes gene_type:complete
MGLRNEDIQIEEVLINELDLFVVTVKGYVDLYFLTEEAALHRAIQIEQMNPTVQNLLELKLIHANYRLDNLEVVDGGR